MYIQFFSNFAEAVFQTSYGIVRLETDNSIGSKVFYILSFAAGTVAWGVLMWTLCTIADLQFTFQVDTMLDDETESRPTTSEFLASSADPQEEFN